MRQGSGEGSFEPAGRPDPEVACLPDVAVGVGGWLLLQLFKVNQPTHPLRVCWMDWTWQNGVRAYA